MRPVLVGAGSGLLAGTILAVLFHGRLVRMDAVSVLFSLLVCSVAGILLVLAGKLVGGRVRHRIARPVVVGLACLPVLWLSGDVLYSLLIRRGYALWAAGIEREADGVRVGCREFTVGKGDTALLLIHGFADSPSVYRRMAPALASRGFTCRAMRLPHFAMPMSQYRKSTAAGWREALRSELLNLAREHRRVVVVATSLGGAVAIDYLADHPESAAGVVLLAPLVDVSSARSPLLSPRGWFNLLDHALIFADRVRSPFTPTDLPAESRAFLKTDEFIPRTIYRELFPLIDRNRERASRFRVPLLMVLAPEDPVINNRAAEWFFGECPAMPKRLVHLQEGGHVIPLDRGWETTVEEVVTFVRELPGDTVGPLGSAD
jgi:carboxylesterase